MSIERPVAPDPYELLPATASFTVTSSDVTDGQPLKDDQVADAGNTSPQLSWSGAPEGTRSLRRHLLRPRRAHARGFWHWVLVDLPADVTSLDTGAAAGALPGKAFHVRNDGGEPASWAPPRRRATRCTATTSWCTPSARTASASTPPSPRSCRFNLAFKTLGRAIITGTYQH